VRIGRLVASAGSNVNAVTICQVSLVMCNNFLRIPFLNEGE